MTKKIFGTDGIRGTANSFPITPGIMLKVGKAIAHIIEETSNQRPRVVIGKDTRLSGYMIESALESGLSSHGADVFLVGPMPTPAIAHLTKSLNADIGIVISASHNPAQDNGIKVFDSNGHKISEDMEKEIESLIHPLDSLNGLECEHVKGERIGKAFRIDDAKGRYIEFAKS